MKHKYTALNNKKHIRATLLPLLLLMSATVMGQSWNMVNGDTVHIDACQSTGGMIYDNGGPNGNYSDYFNGWVVIEAQNGMSITLEGNYRTEGCCDHITVWDGNTSGTVLVNQVGNEGTISATATSGRMTIYFHTDGSVTYEGFALMWSREGIVGNCSSNITSLEAVNVTPTTATLSWTAAATSLYLDYGQGEQYLPVAGNGISLSGLNPNTLYNVKLYGAGEQANPCCIARTSFRTGCGLMAAPLVEHFDDLTVGEMPPCWDKAVNFDSPSMEPQVSQTTANSGLKSLSISSGANSTGGHFALAMAPKMNETMSALKVHLSLRSNMSGAQIEIGVCDTTSTFYNYYGFTPIDTLYIPNYGTWYEYDVPLNGYTGNGCRVAFRMIQSMQPGAGCLIYIDDLTVESCGVDALTVSRRGMDEMTLSWNLIGNPTVDLMAVGGGQVLTASGVTSPYHITGLQPGTLYTLTLTPHCGSLYGATKTTATTTLLPDTAAMSYCEDFEQGWPSTWFRPEIYGGCPQRTSSNSYVMQMRSEYGNLSTAVLPYSSSPISGLTIQLQMRTDNTGDGIVIGVMDYPMDISTFTPIDTIVSTNTNWTYYTSSLANYSGTGRYIAIRTQPQDTYNRYLYIDNISIGNCLLTGLTAPTATSTSVTLQWDFNSTEAELADSVVIEYGSEGFTLGSGTRLAVLPATQCTIDDGTLRYTVTGLTLGTSYQFAVYRQCGDQVCLPQRVTRSTQLRDYVVPFCENFDNVQGDNYVFLPDWGRTSMFDGRPCLWQYGESAPSPSRVLDMHSYGPLSNGMQHSTAILPHLDYNGPITDLVVSFYGQFNNTSYTGYLELGVMSNPADESTFVPVQTVTLPYNRFEHFALPLHNYSGSDGNLALRYYHSCNYCYITAGIDNLEVRTSGIGHTDIVSLRSNGATLEFDTVGPVSTVTLRLIVGDDTTSITNVASPYNISGLLPGTTYRYELDYGQCFPVGGTFTTPAEPLGADWCYDFETDYSNNRPNRWTFPYAYGTGSGDYRSGNRGLYLTSYDQNISAAVLPYIEEDDYTGLHVSFWAKGSGYNRTIIGLLTDPRDTVGLVPLDTLDITDNVWRHYEIELGGHEAHGHHLVFMGTSNRCCNTSYTDIDDLRLSRGDIDIWSYTPTATTITFQWTVTGVVDSVQCSLSSGQWSIDTTVNSTQTLTITDLQPGTSYTATLTPVSILSTRRCSLTSGTVATLSHDFTAGYCETAEGQWSVLPEGWTWLAQDGQQPWKSNQTSRYQRQTIALRSQSPASAYTMIVSPEAIVPLQDLVLGCSAWYGNEESVQASWLVVGVMSDPSDATTFVALDTLRLSYYMQQFSIDLSYYTGNARHVAFKAMSLDGYDRTAYITDIGLASRMVDRPHAGQLTPTSATLQWTVVGSAGSVQCSVSNGQWSIDTTLNTQTLALTDLQPSTTYTATFTPSGSLPSAASCQQRSVIFTTPLAPLTLPLCIPFDDVQSTATDAANHHMPYGWTRPYGNQYPCSSTTNYSGGRSLQFYAYRCGSSSDMSSMAVSPYIEGNLAGLYLDMWVLNNSSGRHFIVGTVADPSNPSTFIAHDTLLRYQNWSRVSLNLDTYSGHYLAIKYDAQSCNSGSGYIDNISLMQCPMPNAWLSNQEDTSLSVNFTGTSPVWIEYALGSDFTPGNGTLLSANSSPLHIGGLTPASTYTFHVWPRCSDDTFVCNYNILTHTTMHPPVAVPYCHNFENFSDGGYPDEWQRWNPDGTTCAVSSYGGHDDNRSLRLVASNSQNVTAILPRLQSSSLCNDSFYINFWAKRRSGSNLRLVVGVVGDLGDTTTFTAHDTVLIENNWKHHTIGLPIAAVRGGRVALRLLSSGDILIDNICVEHCVAYNATVTDMTQHTATITWDSHGVDTLVCEYGRTGFAQGTGTVLYITTSPFVITGLSASSDYQFRFSAICSCITSPGVVYPGGGGSGGSTWWNGSHYIGGVYVDTSTGIYRGTNGDIIIGSSTQAELLNPPYCEDFDTCDVGVMPAGWRARRGSTAGYPRTTRDMALSGARCLDLYTTSGYATHASLPPVDNPAGLIITFDAYCTNSEARNRNYGVITVGVMTDPDKGETFTAVDTLTLSEGGHWQTLSTSLASYTGTGQYIAIRLTPRSSSYHYYIDNVYLGSTAVTSSSATVSGGVVTINYQTIGNSTGVIIDYGDGSLTATSSPVTLTGMDMGSQREITLQAFSAADTQVLCHVTPIIINPLTFLPYCENFDAVGGRFPTGWTMRHQYSSGTNFNVSNGVLNFEANSSNPAVLLLPELAGGENLGDLYVSLQYHAYNNTSANYNYTYLDLGYLTDTADWNTFITLATVHNTSALQTHTVQLDPSTATRLALRGRSSSGTRRFDIDNLVVYRQPTPREVDLTQQSVGYAIRHLEWQASPLLTHYSCEYGPAGFAPGTGTVVLSDSCSLTLTGLEPATDYDIYFIDSAGHYACSPVRFITPTPIAVPYCDDFSTYGSGTSSHPSGWTWNVIGSDNRLYITSSNNYSLYFYSYYYSSETDYITAVLPEPFIDSVAMLHMHLRYIYGSNAGVAEVGVMDAADDWQSFTPVDTLPGDATNVWYEASVDFSRYHGTGRFPAIRFGGHYYQYNYLYIDQLDLQTVPFPHLSVAGSTSIVATTLSDNQSIDYWLEICPDGTSQGTGTVHHVRTSHYIVDNLQPNTTYHVYTRPDSLGLTCAAPLQIVTPDRLNLPYCDDFDTYGSGSDRYPTGWRRSGNYVYTTSSNNYSLFFYGYPYNPSDNYYAVLPDIDIDSLRHASLTIRYYAENAPLCIGIMTDPDDLATFDTVYYRTHTDNYQWYTATVDLASYTGRGRFLAFIVNHEYYRYDYLYLDYLRLQSCPAVSIGLAGHNTVRTHTAAPTADYWLTISGGGIDSLIHITDNPHLITALADETEYTFSVRCDSSVSSCAPPVTITTGRLQSLPYCENFDTYGSGSSILPTGWRQIINCSNDQIYTTSNNNYSLCLQSYYYNQCDLLAILPDIDIDSLRHASLMLRYCFEQYSCPAEIGIMTDPDNQSTFVPIYTLAGTATYTWYDERISLASYTGDGRYLAIRMRGNYNYYKYLYIDHLYIQPMPLVRFTLPRATTIVANVDPSCPADYWLHYTRIGSGDTTHIHVLTHDYILDSLPENTSYSMLATPDSTTDGCWTWTTVTTAQQIVLPLCENLDSYNQYDLPLGWQRYSMGTRENYPRVWVDGSMIMDFAWEGTQVLITPEVENINRLRVHLDIKSGQNTDIMVVGVMTDPTDLATFVAVDTLTTDATHTWEPAFVSFSNYTGNGRYAAFWFQNTDDNQYYFYLDNLVFDSCGASGASARLIHNNTIQITAAEGGFYVEYGPTGFTQGTGTMQYVDVLPFNLTLDYSTTYDFYFHCSPGEVGCLPKQTISTLPQPEELSWCIGFEGMPTGTAPTGWPTLFNPSAYGQWVEVQSSAIHSGSRSLRMLSYYGYSNTVCLPESTVDSLGKVTMSFYIRYGSYNGGTFTVGAMSAPSDASSFIPVATVPTSANWQRQMVDFSGVPSTHRFIAFRNEGPDNEVYIDDIHLAACGAHGLQIVEVESESVVLGWRQTGQPTVTLEVTPIGGTPYSVDPTQAITQSSNNTITYTLSGLDPLTNYSVRLNASCGEDDAENAFCSTDYDDSVHFFTPAGGVGCIDPTNLTADYASCFTGSYGNPYERLALIDSGYQSISSRHTVHYDTTERDARTGGLLRTVPQGARASVRLGNWGTGGGVPEAEAVTYALNVDTMVFDLLVMRYAAVLQDPMHDAADQPRFRLELLDGSGSLIDPMCGAADFIADQALGWNTATGGVLWKDWTTVGLDLSAYAGQTVYIRLTTYDCNEGSHYGYAYFTLDCMRRNMSSESCGYVASNVFTAPSGFAYRWYTNQSDATVSTDQSISIASNNDVTYYCQLSFIDNPACNFTMSAFAGTRFPLALFDDEVVMRNCRFELTLTNRSTISADGVTPVGSGEGTEGALWIIDGVTSTGYHASATFDDEGTHDVTLVATIAGGSCLDTVSRQITLVRPPTTPHIEGPTDRCYGAPTDTLWLREAEPVVSGSWQPSTGSWQLITAPTADTIYTLEVTDTNGCPQTVGHTLHVHPIHPQYDTLVLCESQLPYSYGDTVFTNPAPLEDHQVVFVRTSTYGCDSSNILSLTLHQTTYGTASDTVDELELPHTYHGLTLTEGVSDTTVTLTSASGCDSVVSYSMTVIYHPKHTWLDSTVCSNHLPISWQGHTLTAAGTDSVVLTARHGEDSIVTLTLNVTPVTFSHLYDTIVENMLPYIWNNLTFIEEGSLIDTLTNVGGCDSIVTMTLTVHPNVGSTADSTVCATALPLQWNHRTFTAAGWQMDTLQSSTGSDSILTMRLYVMPVYNDTINVSICDNEQYAFEGSTYNGTDAGLHSHMLHTYIYGCDSLRTLNLEVRPTTTGDTVADECDNFTWYGETYTSSTSSPIHTSTNTVGCDSTTTLHLTVRYSTTSTIHETIVENDLPYTFNGVTFTDSVDATTITIANAVGCDSVINYSLTVDWNTGSRLDSNVCLNMLPITWNGETFDTTVANTLMVRTIVIPSTSGSDSTIIMRVHVRPIYNDTLPYSICDNEQYTFENTLYDSTDAGLHSHMLHTYIYGCDSLRTLNLEVRATTTGDTIADECDTFTWYGETYSSSTSSPTHLSTNIVGCDSTTTLHLTVRYSTTSTIHETIVENDLPYTFNGVTFTDSVDATTITIANAVGCDSVINYSLTVDWNTGSRLDSNVCFNMLPITWNGLSFDTTVANTTMMKTVVIPSYTGSDSTIIMRVHVRPIYNDTLPYSICDNEQYTFENTTYDGTDAGLHSHMLYTDIYSCDSLRTLNLEVRPTTTGDTVADECDTFTWYGVTYTSSTSSPTHLSTNIVGCDSTTTLHLTIRYSTTSTIHETIVENDLPYTFNGVTFTEDNFGGAEAEEHDSVTNAVITIPNAVGCDSVITYTLAVEWNTGSRLDSNVCFNMLPITWNSLSFDTMVANTTIIKTVVISSYTGSDSTIIMRVHVRPIYNDTLPYSICDNEQYTFEDTAYDGTDAGLHSHMLYTDIYGCDSLRTLNLEVRPTTTGDTIADECDTFTWYGETYTTSTETPTHLSQNCVQCDSTTTLHLTIRYSTASTYYDTVVENLLPHTFNGVVFGDSVSHTAVTIANAVQCDSVIDYSLFVHWNVDTTLYDTLCNNALPTVWNGQTFDTTLNELSGTLLRSTVLTAQHGEDSTVWMYLTVHPLFDHHLHTEICDNQSFTFGDSVFSGQWSVTNDQWTVTHLDSLLSIHGCDSLSTLHLTVHPTFDHHLYDTVCSNVSYTWGTPQRLMVPLDSIVVNTHASDTLITHHSTLITQHFTDSLLSIFGCDSLSSLHLHLLPSYDLHYYDTMCDAHIQSFGTDSLALWQHHNYHFEGSIYDSTGTYVHPLNTQHSTPNTCDSTRTLHLQVYPTYDQHLYDTIYDGDLYTFESTVYDTTGVYPHTLAAIYACDSLRTLHLQRNRRTYNDSILCQNFLPLVWNNVTFADGMGTHTAGRQVMADSVHLQGLNGIDSLVVMTVTAIDTSATVDRLHGCDSLRWQDGVNYTASTTTPYVTLTNAAQCDSVVHLALTVDYTHWATDRHSVCDSMQWIDRQWYYADTLGAIDTIRTVADCDSIVTLDLTVHYSTSTALRDTMCFNQTYNWHGYSVHSDSVDLTEDFPLVDTLSTVYGCDSVVGLILTKMAQPHITFTSQIDCRQRVYTLTADATAPLTAGGEPQPMAYTLWSSVPADPMLDGQERQTTVTVAPQSATDYILYADYHSTPFCPTTASIRLNNIVVPTAEMKVNPTQLTYEQLDFTAYDISHSPEPERTWYIDWMIQGETGPTLYGTAPIDADSVTVALRVYNGLCYDTAIHVLPIHRVAIYAPNAFTPLREDNNRFIISGVGIDEGELFIYNREGLLVYHSKDYTAGWNGRRSTDGAICPQGNYVWKLAYRASDHTSRTEVGTVLLIK